MYHLLILLNGLSLNPENLLHFSLCLISNTFDYWADFFKSFFSDQFNFCEGICINQIINYIFSLIFYIKIKFYIKFWIFFKLIIQILKQKIISKFLTFYKKILFPNCLMQILSTILNYNKKRSLFKYFLLIIIFFISYFSPFPLGPDHYYLYFIFVALIRYELKNLFYSISILSVIPLACSDEDTNLYSEEEKIETINFTNFSNLSLQERYTFVESKIKLKGLISSNYLVEYFITAIFNNVTSGSQLDVENYLNKDLDILLKDNRNSQLNKHSFVRIRPFLLNNSNNSGFPSVVPYKSIESACAAEIELDN